MDNSHSQSNSFYFEPRRYEEHLSMFGKKVLNALVRNWKADQNDRSSYQQSTSILHGRRNQRVLTFRDETTLRQSPQLYPDPANTEQDRINNEIFDDHLVQLESAQAAAHSAQVQQANTLNEVTNIITTRDDLTETAINAGDAIGLNCPSSADLLNCLPNNTGQHTTNDVDWSNMFDTELLSDTSITNAEQVLNNNETQARTSKIQNIAVTLDVPTKKKTKKCDTLKDKTNIEKRKIAPNKDVIPKKVKKVTEETKPIFRKIKYTTAVKNWLDDISANNLEIHEEINSDELPKNAEGTEAINKGVSPKNTDTDVKAKTKGKGKSKKTVQTQLANKGGVMKFDKPKIDKDVALSNSNESDKVSDGDELKETSVTDKIEKKFKEKKNKPKFVAPIKSQIPVRDVQYSVTAVSDETHVEPLITLKDQDLVVVLVYSNGFCQLNAQHTEDSCEPEGLLVSAADQAFYFRGTPSDHVRQLLLSVLENNKVICFEGKMLLIYVKGTLQLQIYDIELIDAKIGGSLIDPDSPPENFSELQKLLSFTPEYTIATECALQKSAWYSCVLRQCVERLLPRLKEDQLWAVFEDIEMKLVPVIAEMEMSGVRVDEARLQAAGAALEARMRRGAAACHGAAGRAFAITSPPQVRALLYDELRLHTTTGVTIRDTVAGGAKSTSEAMLRSLVSVHPLPQLILEYRRLHKAHATFVTGIAQCIKDGFVKPTWEQSAAATGRIACNNPNLQAIPKAPFDLPNFPDDPDTECRRVVFRECFPCGAGGVLVCADFRQVECRVYALCARDQRLSAALRRPGDLFTALAAAWLHKEEGAVSGAERERTKRVVYASMYGAGARTLADVLATTYEHARDLLATFHRSFPALKSFGSRVVAECARAGGRARTVSGRARTLAHIASDDFAARAHAERQAVNFIVQGSAADVLKVAMVRCVRALSAGGVRATLRLSIHDELLWELPLQQLDHAARIIKSTMEECGRWCGLEGALPVSLYAGPTWGHMQPYNIP